MKKYLYAFSVLFLFFSLSLSAQQLPNNQFEDWSGAKFDGNEQPASWNYCNVTQQGFSFNFAHKETGHNGGYCMMVQDQDLKVMGIGETSPGYVSLGTPWVHVDGLNVSEATAGTYGGIQWKYRPDTMTVWIKRTGSHAMDEDFHILYYAWNGTAKGNSYMGKNGNCTSVDPLTDEESDIRQSTDKNACNTITAANQVAEGWVYGRQIYNDWTLIKIPIYYMDNSVPAKMNVIFSASNYPNFRANSGLYAGNSLYVDDVQLIYSSKIHQLLLDGNEWKSFNPNSTEIQYYTLGKNVTTVPTIKAYRGAGQLTNSQGKTANFLGRQLQGDEISIQYGTIDETPTTITVKAEDGSSQTTYQILFTHTVSTNAYLASILIDGEEIPNFNSLRTDYTVQIPYGSSKMPTISVLKQDDKQSVSFTQPSNINDVTQIVVTAADKSTTQTYTIRYKQALLADNELAGIKVNGEDLSNFVSGITRYTVDLPLGTSTMPTIEAISKYAAGLQTIVMTPPTTIDGGTYQIAVSTPGAPTPLVYKLTFRLRASSNCNLQSIFLDGTPLTSFSSSTLSYTVALPMGTTNLPEITYTKGDSYQSVEIEYGGLDGTTRIIVTAANGDVQVYKLNFSTAKSTISTLDGITLNGQMLEGFDPSITYYSVQLPIGTTALPEIAVTPSDPYETVSIRNNGLNGITRISVLAGDGISSTIYQISFSVVQATDATLKGISINGTELNGFSADVLEYDYTLPSGTTELPTIGYTPNDPYQTITTRSNGVEGDYKITVRPQTGSSQTYVIHFRVQKSDNAQLQMIYIDGSEFTSFQPDVFQYEHTLSEVQLPVVTYTGDQGQKIYSYWDDNICTIKVTAESGKSNTYTIKFTVPLSDNAFLGMIFLDNDSLQGFSPEELHYKNIYINGNCPTISVTSSNGQQVTILAPAGAGTARIIVTASDMSTNTYILELADTTLAPIPHLDPEEEYVPSADATLQSIRKNGIGFSDFDPSVLEYTLTLAADENKPTLTFVPNSDKQSVIAGLVRENTYQATVTAEDGIHSSVYTVHIQFTPYSDAYLQDLQVEGKEILFIPETLTYHFQLERGQVMPNLHYQTKPGQTVFMCALNDTTQQLIVTAQNGTQNTYLITYTREVSNNALLRDILIDGKSMPEFDAHIFTYTDTLAFRTLVVPSVNAIGTIDGQTITTYFSAVNGTTYIHVVAQDGITTSDYAITFPTRKSSNAALKSLTVSEGDLLFNANTTEYTVHLSADIQSAPSLIFEKGEKEQMVTYIAGAIDQPSQVIVQAEDGSKRTYSVTFIRDVKDNFLDSIVIYPFTNNSNRIYFTYSTLSAQTDLEIQLPYAATQMGISYTKRYPSQTVLVEPGGLYHSTKITVLSNDTLPTIVYTLNPHVETQNPAVLSGIFVDGTALPEFDPNQFSYIISLQTNPIIDVTHADGVTCNVLSKDSKHWQAQVTKDGHSNIYDLWFYYKDDVIPNGEFTEWTTAKYNSGAKPVGWQVIADAVNEKGTYSSGGEVKQDPTGVAYLYTRYPSALGVGGMIPGFITLGTISGTLGVAGSSTFQVDGGISFHNTPDIMSVRYKAPAISTNNRIIYRLTGTNGYKEILHKDANTISDYTVLDMDLSEANAIVVTPTLMNIILNSYHIESGTIAADEAKMYVDWVRFTYKNTLTGIQVNGKEATRKDNKFTVALDDAENVDIPQLIFHKEVADQAQKVIWKDAVVENKYSVRHATITNYGEDGSYSTYTLEVKRPLSDNTTLSGLKVNGLEIPRFSPEQTEYTYHIDPTCKTIPDIQPIPASNLQTCKASSTTSSYSIQITSEAGSSSIYTINFVKDDSTATLKNIYATGVNFKEDQFNYTITADELPTISCVKKYDDQILTISEGTIEVKAPNGNTQIYQIKLAKPEQSTSGQLSEMEFNGNVFTAFSPDTYRYEQTRPEWMAFTRKDAADSVVYTQTPDSLMWEVYGTERHTYVISLPNTKSSSTELSGIYVNNQLIDGFDAKVFDYIVYSDTAVQLRVEGSNVEQQIAITQVNGTYSIQITAQDGSTALQSYTIAVLPSTSNDATLKAIYIDEQPIPNFDSQTLTYTITIPAGEYKENEPSVPTITYIPADEKAQIEVDARGCFDTTRIYVDPSDENAPTKIYSLVFVAEPSHNAQLTNLAVNGIPINNFKSDSYFYSVSVTTLNVQFDWRSKDKYQQVSIDTISDIEYIIHVVAQDQQTMNNYHLWLNKATLSNDATLKNILINGQEMSSYCTDLNTDLSFTPGQNKYKINIPYQQDYLPQISAILKLDDQVLNMRQTENTIYLDVVAPDSSINTYSLIFVRQLSQNALLNGFLLDGEEYADFHADQHFYLIDIPVGKTIADIFPIKAEAAQQWDSISATTSVGKQYTFTITAEDQMHQEQYVILFRKILSNVDTLQSIMADSLHFQARVFNYNCSWPYGKSFPKIELSNIEPGDKYQSISIDTLEQTTISLTYQITVTAENGQYTSYTITYTMQQSSKTTLNMIFINGTDSLPMFNPYTTEYVYTLPIGSVQTPRLVADGDSTQTIIETTNIPSSTLRALSATQFEVIAQNGDKRIYTITFVLAPDTTATLPMIYYNAQPVPRYDELIMDYLIQLNEHETQLPLITYIRSNKNQQIEIIQVDTNQIQLHVTAEDGISQATYTLTFLPYLSNNGQLAAIFLNDTLLDGFTPTKDNYEIKIDSLSSLPTITYTLSESTQRVVVTTTYYYSSDSLIYDVQKTLKVIPENQIDTFYYDLIFHIKANTPLLPEESENGKLSSIFVRGKLISKELGFDKNFTSDTTDYYLMYPIGSNPELFFTDSDVVAQVEDSLAKIISKNLEITHIELDTAENEVIVASIVHILVLAPAGNLVTYNLHQELILDSLNQVTSLMVADDQGIMHPINNFSPNTFYYEYSLSDTRNIAPDFTLTYNNKDSRFAYINFERNNNSRVVDSSDDINYALDDSEDDPTYHICYHAENGSTYRYKIKFRRTEIIRSQKPMEGDVLIQPIPGSNQIAIASLRANVKFGLYDMSGKLVKLIQLEEGNPNDFITITDGYGQTYFGHITDYSSCTILTLEPSKLYFWVFTEGGKRKIKSGKLVILP